MGAALLAMMVSVAATPSVAATTDSGNGGDDTGTPSDTGAPEAPELSNPDDSGASADDSAVDDGYQGWGPVELAGEKGGCFVVSQSAAYLGLLLWVGAWRTRRQGADG
jgi:hypothetical protein